MLNKPTFLFIISSIATSVFGNASVSNDLYRYALALDSLTEAKSHITYEVYMPTAPDPVVYTIDTDYQAAESDTVAPFKYIIKWQVPTATGTSEGFNAYFEGNAYRFSHGRLSEYHFDSDPQPFLTPKGSTIATGALFAQMLPKRISDTLREMATDTTYIFYDTNNTPCRVRGVKRQGGYDAFEFDYVFDQATLLPLRFETIYNPAAISEQTTIALFEWDSQKEGIEYTEEALIKRFSEQFAKYRRDNYRVENLKGVMVPQFTAPTLSHGRYSHNAGQGFRAPTLIVFLSLGEGNPAETIAQVRQAVAEAPLAVDVIYAFTDNDFNATDSLFPETLEGETVLLSAKSMARDLGVTTTPTLLFVNKNGVVKAVLVGSSAHLKNSLLQNIML